ncbi:hypothetical protein LAZ67_11003122 [Cordylochernes scorpioides]|uniref:Uncharacterized protein n=1 Tax=Cordylochernes scorpioides TaxID=51811 RepID=A0ABY6KZN1_9ARAC|nr:hypothetical protein LAZ67_11003122 [Cordylochernes scorpioides]
MEENAPYYSSLFRITGLVTNTQSLMEILESLELLLNYANPIDLSSFLNMILAEEGINENTGMMSLIRIIIRCSILKHPTTRIIRDMNLPNDLFNYWKICQSQVAEMQNHLMGKSDITMYRFLTEMDRNKVAGFLANDSTRLKENIEFDKPFYEQNFTNYLEIIQTHRIYKKRTIKSDKPHKISTSEMKNNSKIPQEGPEPQDNTQDRTPTNLGQFIDLLAIKSDAVGFSLTPDTFDKAWFALNERYHCTRDLAYKYCNNILNINNIKLNLRNLELLGINDEQLRNMLLTTFIFKKIDCNKNKDFELPFKESIFPTLQELLIFLEKNRKRLDHINGNIYTNYNKEDVK